jgi:hypothetical protein
MKWFRSKLTYGTRLALFALAVQFVLSFGHFHPDEAHAAPAASQAASTISATAPSAGKAELQKADLQKPAIPTAASPSKPDHPTDSHPHDICAICAVMALAGAAMFAGPPILRLPQAYHFLYATTDAEFSHLANDRADFQPRAPPAS